MNKIRLALLTIFTLLTFLLAACSGPSPAEKTPTRIPSAGNSSSVGKPEYNIPVDIDIAPDFSLPDKNGDLINLEDELQKNMHVVLVFYFGNTCPPCIEQLREIENDMAKYKEVNAQVIAIAVQDETMADISARKSQAQFPILADRDRATAEAYGVLDGYMSTPAVFIINQDREVVWGVTSHIPYGCGSERVPSQTILENIQQKEG
jgi:peroxiredoxin